MPFVVSNSPHLLDHVPMSYELLQEGQFSMDVFKGLM